jgi:hypothetical protein
MSPQSLRAIARHDTDNGLFRPPHEGDRFQAAEIKMANKHAATFWKKASAWALASVDAQPVAGVQMDA